ncbi:Cdc37 N terminal kinase binding-domain-containing protein [Chaetomium tenue]|uniref:Cdc37 N terminal kinase binding-domain-containing protein n=1 Tax=Chaetomium tenue TaxID=1854479 RepID=A0ACB7NYI6_9PEZI|nr:Cdc37 N terminal kinase binding-domain-containing protein [Chaetomium globosum]
MVDYSKWVCTPSSSITSNRVCYATLSNELWQDALELSDDSDIEVHPNVDKRSFIRAKQNQIHMERQQRKLQIEAYKHQRVVNEALIQRLSVIISAVQSQNTSSDQPADTDPSDIAFKTTVELALRNPEDDTPPPRPDGISDPDSPPLPRYSKMVATVLDEVNKALARRHIKDRTLRFEALIEELKMHIRNIEDAQKELAEKLDELEQQSSKKITSDNYRVGFDTSHVSKSAPAEKKLSSSSKSKMELLNPVYDSHSGELATGRGANSVGSAIGSGVNQEGEEEAPRASPLATRFAQIQTSDYRASHDFLISHPEIVQEPRESDGLLFEAYTILLNDGHEARPRAQQYTHQALLLQYCHLLGRDGVIGSWTGSSHMATPGHQAREAFEKDLAQTFQRIVDMAKRDAKKRRDGAETERLVERVQLCSLADGEGSARIVIPPAESDDEEGRKSRAIFESFAPEMRAALETGSLDEVNKVLGEMETSEAEELASLLTESGCMSIEGEVIDATTEDGKKTLEELRSVGEVDKEEAA